MAVPKAFYAYPSQPPSLTETIEEAIAKINEHGLVKVKSWKDLNPTGHIIIKRICREIANSDVFMCDVSGLNPNVLFELGYAVAKNKRIWITVDRGNPKNIDLTKAFDVLSMIGYRAYVNYDDIVKSFFVDRPHESMEDTILNEFRGILDSAHTKPELDFLYMKSVSENTASKKLTQFLDKSVPGRRVVADPLENSYQPLNWYLSHISNAASVIVHLLSQVTPDHEVNNAKYSFYAGMARGFNRSVLMLAPEPYETPLDYQDLLVVHKTGAECVDHVEKWIYRAIVEGKAHRPQKVTRGGKDTELALLEVRLGESTAEYEEDELDQYFVETGQYKSALDTQMGVFVGRKGSGKTANLIRIRDHFQAEKNNLVIVIKPLSFRLEAYIRLIETYFSHRDLAADVTERIWKFLIYTKIAEELYSQLQDKPIHYERSSGEEALCTFVEDNIQQVCAEFGDKVEYISNIVQELCEERREPKEVLAVLASNYISPLISILQNVLKPYQRVVILVDNLDKGWEAGRDLEAQSQIIYGLMGFQLTLKRDLTWQRGDARIIVFLREDIFSVVLRQAREPDKVRLMVHKILWDDPVLLLRVIEERFMSHDPTIGKSEIWEKYFAPSVGSLNVRDYLLRHVIPRPRDLIFLLGNAIDECINHGHDIIEPDDLRKAHRAYFEFLVENAVTEYAVNCPQIRDILLAFHGLPRQITYRRLRRTLSRFETLDNNLEDLIDLLIRMSFLGVVVNNQTEFAYDDQKADMLVRHVRNQLRRPLFSNLCLEVHPAFGMELWTVS